MNNKHRNDKCFNQIPYEDSVGVILEPSDLELEQTEIFASDSEQTGDNEIIEYQLVEVAEIPNNELEFANTSATTQSQGLDAYNRSSNANPGDGLSAGAPGFSKSMVFFIVWNTVLCIAFLALVTYIYFIKVPPCHVSDWTNWTPCNGCHGNSVRHRELTNHHYCGVVLKNQEELHFRQAALCSSQCSKNATY